MASFFMVQFDINISSGTPEPLRGFRAVPEYTDFDRRTLSQDSMKSGIMNGCRIRSKNRRLYRWTTCIDAAPIERNAKHVLEVKVNFGRSDRVEESIER